MVGYSWCEECRLLAMDRIEQLTCCHHGLAILSFIETRNHQEGAVL